ncbi:hypothetical protein M422DRAFT_28137 [Sphaerobolus stellatus SS14]|nr:hypothetical protein M422DRAFT_28137 [Sphaerobolus stellatus SS14]
MLNLLPSFQTFLKATTASAMGLSTITAGLLWYGQGYLLYPSAFPSGSRESVPTPAPLDYEDLTLETVDGVKIRSYLMMASKNLSDDKTNHEESDEDFARRQPTVMMFHGNGGNMGHRIPLAVKFLQMRCNVMMVSYRGYGLSEGTPSEKGFKIDSQTALDYLISHPVLGPSDKGPGSKIILYGQSIGGAVAIDLAVRNPNTITAIILENTFLSIPRLIPSAIPFLAPFTFLCHQVWNSEEEITKLPPDMALLMLSGSQDEIVPASHMKELWEIAQKSGRKKAIWIEFPEGQHNTTVMQHGYWRAVYTFIEAVEKEI